MDLLKKINDFQELAVKYWMDRTDKSFEEDYFKESFKIFLPPKIYWSIDDFKKEMLLFAMKVEKNFIKSHYGNRQLQKIVENKITESMIFKKFVSDSCNLLKNQFKGNK